MRSVVAGVGRRWAARPAGPPMLLAAVARTRPRPPCAARGFGSKAGTGGTSGTEGMKTARSAAEELAESVREQAKQSAAAALKAAEAAGAARSQAARESLELAKARSREEAERLSGLAGSTWNTWTARAKGVSSQGLARIQGVAEPAMIGAVHVRNAAKKSSERPIFMVSSNGGQKPAGSGAWGMLDGLRGRAEKTMAEVQESVKSAAASKSKLAREDLSRRAEQARERSRKEAARLSENARSRASEAWSGFSQRARVAGAEGLQRAKESAASSGAEAARRAQREIAERKEAIRSMPGSFVKRVDPMAKFRTLRNWVIGILLLLSIGYGAGKAAPYAVANLYLELDKRGRKTDDERHA